MFDPVFHLLFILSCHLYTVLCSLITIHFAWQFTRQVFITCLFLCIYKNLIFRVSLSKTIIDFIMYNRGVQLFMHIMYIVQRYSPSKYKISIFINQHFNFENKNQLAQMSHIFVTSQHNGTFHFQYIGKNIFNIYIYYFTPLRYVLVNISHFMHSNVYIFIFLNILIKCFYVYICN